MNQKVCRSIPSKIKTNTGALLFAKKAERTDAMSPSTRYTFQQCFDKNDLLFNIMTARVRDSLRCVMSALEIHHQ